MFNWLSFFNIFFFIFMFVLIIFSTNFFTLLVVSEILWLILYVLSVIYGSFGDDVNSYAFTFFTLGFAAIEFSVGVMFIIFLKNSNISIDFSINTKFNKFFFEKNFFNKFFSKKKW